MSNLRPQITDTERKQVLTLRAQKLAYAVISERTGIPRRRVESILREYTDRELVQTRCIDCPAIIKQRLRPYEARLHRCCECAARLAMQLKPPIRVFAAGEG